MIASLTWVGVDMGEAAERIDSRGREKVVCGVCGGFFHRVDLHIERAHELTLEAYRARYPRLPIMSEAGRRRAERDKPDYDPNDLEFGVARLKERPPHDADDVWVPTHDDNWVVGAQERKNLEYLALAVQDDENVLLVGPPGVGKTTMVRELAAMCNAPLRRLPFHGEMRVSDLVGSKDIVVDAASGQTVTRWTLGPLPDAAERGHWVLFDEFDSAPAQTAFLLFSALEHPRQLTLTGFEGGRQVAFDERFRVFATANTLGYGDDTGLFAGTAPMNEALLDRFGVVIRVDYPDLDDEVKMLVARTGIESATAARMVEVATKIREAQKQQTTTVSLSPRRISAWALKTLRLDDPLRASEIAILNKLPHDDSEYVRSVIQRHFGGKL